jgi:ABC-type multidrug transport system fused ATPase/permease subunit
MEESFERVLLQKLYSLEKLSLRLSDKVQRSETENLKFLGKIHASINELERKAEEQCGKRRDKLQEKVSDLRELLFTSEGDASKTRESFSQGLGAKFKDVYEGLDKTNKIAGSLSTAIRVLETRIDTHLREENSKFSRYATIISLIISLLALSGVLVFGIIQVTPK